MKPTWSPTALSTISDACEVCVHLYLSVTRQETHMPYIYLCLVGRASQSCISALLKIIRVQSGINPSSIKADLRADSYVLDMSVFRL